MWSKGIRKTTNIKDTAAEATHAIWGWGDNFNTNCPMKWTSAVTMSEPRTGISSVGKYAVMCSSLK